MQRHGSGLILILVVAAMASVCRAQDLPITRRFSTLTTNFIDNATQVAAAPVAEASGSVQVIFRTSEQGAVIDTRLSGGSHEMQLSADAALKQWRFKPAMINGQPGQIFSAVVFTFSNEISSVAIAKPMTSQQLTPALGFPCPNALSHQTQDAAELCKKQLDMVARDKKNSPMEGFSAHYEYGVALLYAQEPDLALEQFTQAIQLAPMGLKNSDAEWADVYWLRGTAESKLGKDADARRDLATAQKSMGLAEVASSAPFSVYYHRLGEQITAQLSQASPRLTP